MTKSLWEQALEAHKKDVALEKLAEYNKLAGKLHRHHADFMEFLIEGHFVDRDEYKALEVSLDECDILSVTIDDLVLCYVIRPSLYNTPVPVTIRLRYEDAYSKELHNITGLGKFLGSATQLWEKKFVNLYRQNKYYGVVTLEDALTTPLPEKRKTLDEKRETNRNKKQRFHYANEDELNALDAVGYEVEFVMQGSDGADGFLFFFITKITKRFEDRTAVLLSQNEIEAITKAWRDGEEE